MDTPRITINAITLLTLLLCGNNAAQAQGMAFTYQGRLNQNGIPANGSYDLKFSLFDAASGGSQVANSLTNAPTGVTEGLFTVVLDFGPGVFNGAALWLAIGVRTNGSSADFTTLSPRQPVTSDPYAIYALNAGAAATANKATTAASADAVAASNITGTIPDARLSPNVALLNNNPNFTGTVTATTFNGSGAGLNNVPASSLSGIVPDGRLSSNVAQLSANQTFSGANTLNNAANSFVGNGAGLSALNASSLASGIVPDARLSANVARLSASQNFSGVNTFNNAGNTFTGSGVGLTALNASGLASGTVPDARLSPNVPRLNANQTFSGANSLNNAGNTFTGNGAGLTALNASGLATGTVPDPRLSANVALLSNQTNTFNGTVVASDVKLANGFQFAVGALDSVRIVRGNVRSDGITDGDGYSVIKSGTGVYTIIFNTAFTDQPTVISSLYGAVPGRSITYNNILTNSVIFETWSSSVTHADNHFTFMAVGGR